MKVEVRIARILEPLRTSDWDCARGMLPKTMQDSIMRFHRWQDRHSALAGKLLLRRGLLLRGRQSSDMNRLKLTEYGRPFLEGWLDFNISHCDGLAICAFTEQGRVGVDVEVVRDTTLSDFSDSFTESEWAIILGSPAPLVRFYSMWTRKESVLKADGRGLNFDLTKINSEEKHVSFNQKTYETRELNLGSSWIAHLACSESFEDMEIVWDNDWFKPSLQEVG